MAWPQSLSGLSTTNANATISLNWHPALHNDADAAINRIEAEIRTGTVFNVKHYGATGDFGTDDTAAIQAAIDAVPVGGGVVYFPHGWYRLTGSLVLKNNVVLRGRGYSAANTPALASPILHTNGAGAFPLLTSGTDVHSVTIEGLGLTGNAGSLASQAIVTGASGCHDWTIRDCIIESFGGRAIHLRGGIGGKLERIFAQNCVRVRTGHTDWIGVLELDAGHTDVTVRDSAFAASITTNEAGLTGLIAGIVQRSSTAHLSNAVGHFCEVGVVLLAESIGTNKLEGVRSEFNRRQGYVIESATNHLTGCWSFRNGQAAGNTYDGFLTVGAGAGWNTFVNCLVSTHSGDPTVVRYGYRDENTTVTGDPGVTNSYLGCGGLSIAVGTAMFSHAAVVPAMWLAAEDGAWVANEASTSATSPLITEVSGDARYVELAGATMTGSLITSANVQANAVAATAFAIAPLSYLDGGANPTLEWRASAVGRWDALIAGTESGANTGSDWTLNRLSDAGAFLGTALQVNRATGAATFAGAVVAGSVKPGAAAGGALRSGSGAPSALNGTVGDFYFRTDGGAGTYIYVCTVTGTPGTWVGIV